MQANLLRPSYTPTVLGFWRETEKEPQHCAIEELFACNSTPKTREWNGMEWKMEWNAYFGMEYGRCQNGME